MVVHSIVEEWRRLLVVCICFISCYGLTEIEEGYRFVVTLSPYETSKRGLPFCLSPFRGDSLINGTDKSLLQIVKLEISVLIVEQLIVLTTKISNLKKHSKNGAWGKAPIFLGKALELKIKETKNPFSIPHIRYSLLENYNHWQNLWHKAQKWAHPLPP